MMTETPPDVDKCTFFRGSTRTGIESDIDDFLTLKMSFKDIPLMLAPGNYRYSYKGISVREWHHEGNVRYDAAVELENKDD